LLSDEAVSVMAEVAPFLGHDKVAREETVIPRFLGLPVVAILEGGPRGHSELPS